MRKEIKEGRCYFIINTDEPYAEAVYAVLKCGQQMKKEWPEGNVSFDEWHRQTFGRAPRFTESVDYHI